MKRGKIISSLCSVILCLLFLSATTGITVITHHCDACGNYSVKTGLFLPPVEPEDDCCEAADTHCENEASLALETAGCCHFQIDKLKLSGFTSNIPVPFFGPEVTIPFLLNILPEESTTDLALHPLSVYNKHGGRYLITYNCQLLI